jgi:radical SAM superfamily enzyme YgiQ (UPF0313 family)
MKSAFIKNFFINFFIKAVLLYSMRTPSMYYCEPVFRPPSEAYSLLLQATIGCTFRCTFCISNIGKRFSVRPLQDIKKDINIAHTIYGERVKKMFLLDGNAFAMKPDLLIEIAQESFKVHKNLERIGAYAHAKDITRKTDEELKAIREAGIKIAYLGIETGDDDLLKEISKQTTADELASAAQKLHKAGITLSGTVILGLAGNDLQLSKKHAEATARLINRMNPPNSNIWYISALTLMLPSGTKMHSDFQSGKFHPVTKLEALKELEIILKNTSDDLHDLVWRSNHASNYLSLRGNLSEDKEKLLQSIRAGLKNPKLLRSEHFRGL